MRNWTQKHIEEVIADELKRVNKGSKEATVNVKKLDRKAYSRTYQSDGGKFGGDWTLETPGDAR